MGLDKPLVVQYGMFLKDAIRLDFGDSVVDQRPVMEVVWEKLPNTLRLGAAAFIFSFVIGVPLGVLSAVKRNSVWDQMGKMVALLG